MKSKIQKYYKKAAPDLLICLTVSISQLCET